MIRLGLIGCGEHSEIGHAVSLARYISSNPGQIELTAACDIRQDRAELFRQKYGFLRVYQGIDDLLASEKLDVCIAVVPVEKISQLGIKLLKLAVPCVVEKPLGASVQEVSALREAARSTKTPNMVSVNRRFMPMLKRAVDWCGGKGTLRYVRATMTRHARIEPDFLATTAVHAVDALRSIAGEVASASIRPIAGSPDSAPWYGIDLRFQNGALARIDVLPTAGVLEETYELIGDNFRAIVTSPFGPKRALLCYEENRLVLHETDIGIPEDVVFGFFDEACALISSIKDNQPMTPSIEDVFPSVELCLKLTEQAGVAHQSKS